MSLWGLSVSLALGPLSDRPVRAGKLRRLLGISGDGDLLFH